MDGSGPSGSVVNATEDDVNHKKEMLAALKEEENRMDGYIENARMQVREMQVDYAPLEVTELSYVSKKDLQSLECYQKQSVIAIKAPIGSTLEVPDPDEGMPNGARRFQIFLKSAGRFVSWLEVG